MMVRAYREQDIPAMISIWNEVVEEGVAFPQEDFLKMRTGTAFFGEQSYCGVAEDEGGAILGLYILHPNNIGRCGHICNASYAVASASRGRHIGEIIGGSQREERLELLEGRIKELGMNPEDYWWYCDLRRYGSCRHAGYGLGFERMVMYLTGINNIRDTLPHPRTVGNAEF